MAGIVPMMRFVSVLIQEEYHGRDVRRQPERRLDREHPGRPVSTQLRVGVSGMMPGG